MSDLDAGYAPVAPRNIGACDDTEKDERPMKIRSTKHDDIAALQEVLDGTALFPSEMLPDIVGGFLSENDSADIWLTCEADGKPVGFCYAVPEELADGAWNMLAIAVLPSAQGNGRGGAITAHLETELRERGARILIADTSGTDEFAQTRAFYQKSGYSEEARIRDFWAPGDDKVVFWKSLT
ncbi:MAG: GNAT family N-acetyltransferase [Ascidiaceihabitans sp.]|nr:GNAT family N-acetyltransferase [Ascidiaceihabitans sp.]